MKKKHAGKYLVAVVMALVALLWMVPVYYLIINSFKPMLGVVTNISAFPTSFYVDSFVTIWTKNNFPMLFMNSFIITAGSVALTVLVCSMCGYRLARMKNKLGGPALFYLLIGFIIPFQGVMIPLMGLMGKLGLANSRIGMIILYVALEAPLGVFLYYGATKSVPTSLEESAKIDGAGPFRTFFSIIFPLLGSITITLVILASLWIWNDFLTPLILLTDPAKRTIPTGTAALFFGQYASRWDLGITAIFMASIPMILLYLLLQKYIVRGIIDGAVKG